MFSRRVLSVLHKLSDTGSRAFVSEPVSKLSRGLSESSAIARRRRKIARRLRQISKSLAATGQSATGSRQLAMSFTR